MDPLPESQVLHLVPAMFPALDNRDVAARYPAVLLSGRDAVGEGRTATRKRGTNGREAGEREHEQDTRRGHSCRRKLRNDTIGTELADIGIASPVARHMRVQSTALLMVRLIYQLERRIGFPAGDCLSALITGIMDGRTQCNRCTG